MRRYWVDESKIQQDKVLLTDETFHHIIDVCRQDIDSKFEILSHGQAHFVQVIEIKKRQAVCQILETRKVEALKKPHLVLALSLPKFPTMDAVIEKAVEMGVSRIQPFLSDFSFLKKKSRLPVGKEERWQKIILSATQQCGRGELMTLSPLIEFEQLQGAFNPQDKKLGLFAYEGESPVDIKAYLSAKSSQDLEEIWLFVGSEGGFSPTEVQAFKSWGLEAVTLGDQVLRVETACITLAAVLKYEFELMKSAGGKSHGGIRV